jgi:hypothetical protein
MIPFYASPVLRKQLQTAGLLIASLLLQSPVSGEIYKWTDDGGEVHYTQTPPPSGITVQKIEGAPPPADSAETVQHEQQRLQEQLDAMDERRTEQDEATAIKKQHEENREKDEKNCITAQNNLAKLQQGGIKRYLTPEGDVIRLTEEDRQQRISEANSQIEKFCKP